MTAEFRGDLIGRYSLEGFACVARAWLAHKDELLGHLRRQMAEAYAAEDVLQDVFVKAMGQGTVFCTLNNPRAWLFQVARNALVDRSRTAHSTDPLTEDAPFAAPGAAELDPVDALAECLPSMIGKLSPEDAAVLRACDLQGKTLREYAQLCGLSLPASKSRLLRARQRLRERLLFDCKVRFDTNGSVCCHVPTRAT